MRRPAFHVLRVGLGITFCWIGILILKEPLEWFYLTQPWVQALAPDPLLVMIPTAVLDIIVGFLLLMDAATWLAAGIGAGHLFIVMATTGIGTIIIRDLGLFAASLALLVDSFPEKLLERLRRLAR